MKNIVLGLAAVIVIAVVAVAGMASTMSDRIYFDRSITIDGTAADMAPFAEDLRLVNAWSPWDDEDPDLKRTWSDASMGVGAWYAWSGNDEVGSGRQTITSVEPGKVVHRLNFITPFEDQADASITWATDGDKVKVTWAFEKDSSGFGTKVAQVFMDLEAMIGPDYEAGLAKLEPLVVKASEDRLAAEAQARQAEEAAAAVAAAGAAEIGDAAGR